MNELHLDGNSDYRDKSNAAIKRILQSIRALTHKPQFQKNKILRRLRQFFTWMLEEREEAEVTNLLVVWFAAIFGPDHISQAQIEDWCQSEDWYEDEEPLKPVRALAQCAWQFCHETYYLSTHGSLDQTKFTELQNQAISQARLYHFDLPNPLPDLLPFSEFTPVLPADSDLGRLFEKRTYSVWSKNPKFHRSTESLAFVHNNPYLVRL